MQFGQLTSYLKVNYKWFVLLTVVALLFILAGCGLLSLIYFPIFLISGHYRYQYSREELTRLKAKGLTTQDVENIRFVKQWENARKRGMWDYCIINGGFLYGLAISIATSTLMLICTGKNIRDGMDVFGGMFSFIGYNYILGAVIGVIIFRRVWIYNERKFVNLTDPLAGNYFAADFRDL